MARAELTVTLPEATWIGAVSSSNPDTEFRVLAVLPTDQGGVGLLEITGSDLPSVVESMGRQSGLVDIDILEATNEQALVQFETTEPLLLTLIQRSGVPLELPVTIVDGDAHVELTLSRDRLSELGDQFRAMGVDFELEYVTESTGLDTDGVLSKRQRHLLETAIDAGYYDVPRTCTLTELADRLDIAKSTASERLQRAESAVVRSFLREE